MDVTAPIDHADVAAIEAGMDAYAVLVFRDQDLTDERQIAFALSTMYGEMGMAYWPETVVHLDPP